MARTSRGQATSGCYGGEDEAHRTLKAWGELETVTNRTAAVGGMDAVELFFFLTRKESVNQRSLRSGAQRTVMMGGSWLVHEPLAGGKKDF